MLEFYSTLLGLWVMASPFIFNYSGFPRHHDIVVGALIAFISAISTFRFYRGWQFINILLAIWLFVSPFFIFRPAWSSIIVAAALVFIGNGISLKRTVGVK